MFIHWSQFCPLLPCFLILKSLRLLRLSIWEHTLKDSES